MADDRERDEGARRDGRDPQEGGTQGRRGPGDRGLTGDLGYEAGGGYGGGGNASAYSGESGYGGQAGDGPADREDAGRQADTASGDDLRDSVERSGATAWLDGGTSEERKEPKGR